MEIIVGDDPAGLAARRIAARLSDAVRRRGSASLALSGGSTAPALIDALLADHVPWAQVEVWQVDERIAPDGDTDRNAAQLAGLPCPVHLMPVTTADHRAAARRYASALPERFDVVHLGVGGDGHTASWPPDEPEIAVSHRSVELTGTFHGRLRMTLTRRVVNGARSRVVLASGTSKRVVIERWLLRDRSLPISLVRSSGTQVFLDHDAAPDAPAHDQSVG